MPSIDFAAFSSRVLVDAAIPELPNHYRGKVRDNYDLADGRRIIIASDRLSAFDRILCAIPFKGEVLTQRRVSGSSRRPISAPIMCSIIPIPTS
jgi:phosphoribosylaminoimidazole-succinocarboxamide synthase